MVDPELVAIGAEAPIGVVALLPDVFVAVKRDHGASFDRLVRQARELRGDDATASEAAEAEKLSPKSHRPPDRRFRGVKTARPVTTGNRREQAKRGVARLGIEPRTPRFSAGPENPWLSPDLEDFFW